MTLSMTNNMAMAVILHHRYTSWESLSKLAANRAKNSGAHRVLLLKWTYMFLTRCFAFFKIPLL